MRIRVRRENETEEEYERALEVDKEKKTELAKIRKEKRDAEKEKVKRNQVTLTRADLGEEVWAAATDVANACVTSSMPFEKAFHMLFLEACMSANFVAAATNGARRNLDETQALMKTLGAMKKGQPG